MCVSGAAAALKCRRRSAVSVSASVSVSVSVCILVTSMRGIVRSIVCSVGMVSVGVGGSVSSVGGGNVTVALRVCFVRIVHQGINPATSVVLVISNTISTSTTTITMAAIANITGVNGLIDVGVNYYLQPIQIIVTTITPTIHATTA